MNAKRKDYVDNIETREAIKALAEDLRKFANWEYSKEPTALGQAAYRRHRRDTLLFAADYIETAL
jgi:hypothetical protein